MWPALVSALAVLNALSFALFGLDKRRAVRGGRRIPESTLLLSAAVSGTVGAWLAMSVFRHKTRKASFIAKMVGATALDAAALVAVLVLVT